MNEIRQIADIEHCKAMTRYNWKYNNQLYQQATANKSVGYANALIDEALALCGSPFYKVSRRRWGRGARRFLRAFAG